MPPIELCEPCASPSVDGGLTAAATATVAESVDNSESAATCHIADATQAGQLANETAADHAANTRAAGDTADAVVAGSSIVAPIRAATGAAPEIRARRLWRPSTRRWIILASIVLAMRIFVGEASVVPTASMEGTILVGDHLFMDKLLYGPEIPLVHWRLPVIKTIHRGDIVVFRYPKDPSETFLKRVTALGGDRLEIKNGVLYVNSQPVQEPYAVHHAPVHNPLESWGPTVVPEGKLFVMGDNRDNSSDSRDWGFVPMSNVIGEPLFVYWSYDAPTARWLDESPGHRISFYASIAENFFSNTRWNRTGMLL